MGVQYGDGDDITAGRIIAGALLILILLAAMWLTADDQDRGIPNDDTTTTITIGAADG